MGTGGLLVQQHRLRHLKMSSCFILLVLNALTVFFILAQTQGVEHPVQRHRLRLMQPAKATVNQTKNIAERKMVSNYIRERSRKHETNAQKDLGEGVKKTREAEPEMQQLFVGRKPADRKLRNRRRKTSTLRIEEDMKEESMTANPLIKEPKRYRIKPRAE